MSVAPFLFPEILSRLDERGEPVWRQLRAFQICELVGLRRGVRHRIVWSFGHTYGSTSLLEGEFSTEGTNRGRRIIAGPQHIAHLSFRQQMQTLLVTAQIVRHCPRNRLTRLRLVVTKRGAGVYLETVHVVFGRNLQVDSGEGQTKSG